MQSAPPQIGVRLPQTEGASLPAGFRLRTARLDPLHRERCAGGFAAVLCDTA